MKTEKFPLTITEKGVSAVIRKTAKLKDGKRLNYFIVEYTILGERQQVWRSDLGIAKGVARDACIKIANGDQSALELRNGERLAYTRAIEALSPVRIPIDTACREFADALQILGGKASVTEACREWVKRNAVALPKITVANASQQLQRQAVADGKSDMRQKQLRVALDRFTKSFNVEVHTITPALISTYLAGLQLAERSKKNHRDVLKYFSRWLVLRGYLPKGTDLMEGVQKYAARKFGAISIFTPDELKSLLTKADKRLRAFLAIGAFAGLRHSEIKRLDWQQVELSDKPGESYIEVLPIEKTKSDQRRRLVPVKDNLKTWLLPLVKKSGPVCPFKNVVNQFGKLAHDAGVKWRKNGIRHSYCSYRVSECADVPRVADEAGNSPAVIRTNYLRRVKPAVAVEWFGILPRRAVKPGRKLCTS